jgi:hypothetical protein
MYLKGAVTRRQEFRLPLRMRHRIFHLSTWLVLCISYAVVEEMLHPLHNINNSNLVEAELKSPSKSELVKALVLDTLPSL